MKKVLIPITNGFEEIEAISVVDLLRRAHIEVTLASLKAGLITGRNNLKIECDTTLNLALEKDFDMIVLIGGQQNMVDLRKDARVIELIKKFTKEDMFVTAICAAPLILKRAEVIKGKNLTSYPGAEDDLKEVAIYKEERVVVDDKLITSRGPGTAIEFALKLIEVLVGKEKSDEIKHQVLAI